MWKTRGKHIQICRKWLIFCKFPSFLCFLIKSLLVLLRLHPKSWLYSILPLFVTIYFSAFLFMRLDLCKSAVYEGLVSSALLGWISKLSLGRDLEKTILANKSQCKSSLCGCRTLQRWGEVRSCVRGQQGRSLGQCKVSLRARSETGTEPPSLSSSWCKLPD